MVDILTSLHGRKLGLTSDGGLVVGGPDIFINNDSSPVRAAFAGAAVAGGSAITLTIADHSGKLIALDTAAGTTATLPAASGSGAKFRFYVSVLATSNSHIVKVANATDVFIGMIFSMDDTSDNAVAFAAAATSDTITLNRTTTGSVSKGEYIEIEDIASGIFLVRGFITNSGTPATPFSATVS